MGKSMAAKIHTGVKSTNRKSASATKNAPVTNKGMKIMWEDKIQIAKFYDQGIHVKEIAKEYDTSVGYIYRIVNEPEVMCLRDEWCTRLEFRVQQTLDDNMDKIDKITAGYLKLALDKERVKKTPLVQLFTVWGIIMDKQIKMMEINLKAKEIRLRREELKKGKEDAEGLLAAFTKVVNDKSGLTNKVDLSSEREKIQELKGQSKKLSKKNGAQMVSEIIESTPDMKQIKKDIEEDA